MRAVICAGVVIYALEALKRWPWASWVTIRSTASTMLLAVIGAMVSAYWLSGAIHGGADGPLLAYTILQQTVLQQILYDSAVRRSQSRGPIR